MIWHLRLRYRKLYIPAMTFGLVSGMLLGVPWGVIAFFHDMFVWMQGDIGVPREYMTGMLAKDTAQDMAALARHARKNNDLVTAIMYEQEANVQWNLHHAHVLLHYPAHMRPSLPPFPFPNQLPGPMLGVQRDSNLPAWGSNAAQSAATVPAQAMAPHGQHPEQLQGQDPAQPQGQAPVLQTHMQPQPVQVQSTQAQSQALHIGTDSVAQAVQAEAQVGTVVLETACTNDSTC